MTEIIELPDDATGVDAPGFYMARHDVYHSVGFTPELAVNQSGIKTILNQSPAHYWHGLTAGRESTKAMDLGSTVHSMLLGRGAEIVEIPHANFKTKAAQDLRDEVAASGRCPMLTKDVARAQEIVEAARFSLKRIAGAWDVFEPGRGLAEVSAVWQEQGVWCKTAIDWLSNDGAKVFDLKTTSQSAAPSGLARMMVNNGFDVQGAMIKRGIEALRPNLRGRVKVHFVIVEVEPPYGLSVMELDSTALTIGQKKVEMGIRIFKRCMQTDTWPGFPPVIHKPEYPNWEETRFLAQELADADGNLQRISNLAQRP